MPSEPPDAPDATETPSPDCDVSQQLACVCDLLRYACDRLAAIERVWTRPSEAGTIPEPPGLIRPIARQ